MSDTTTKIVVRALDDLYKKTMETQRTIDNGQDSEGTIRRLWRIWGRE